MTKSKYSFTTIALAQSALGFITAFPIGADHFREAERLDQDILNNNLTELMAGLSTKATKEEYLKWVAAWKFLYKAVSFDIVHSKLHRDQPVHGANNWEVSRSYRQSDVAKLKKYATQLLELRRIGKVLSGINRAKAFAEVFDGVQTNG